MVDNCEIGVEGCKEEYVVQCKRNGSGLAWFRMGMETERVDGVGSRGGTCPYAGVSRTPLTYF